MTGDENHGRLATVDLAYRDNDGFYYIAGRKKRFNLFYKNFSVRKIKKIPRNTSGKVLYEQLGEQ